MSIKNLVKIQSRRKRRNRAGKIILFLFIVILGIGLILKVFNDNIVFFFSPTELIAKNIKPSNSILRVGGMVATDSIKEDKNTGKTEFRIIDGNNDLLILYQGILPNLFREGQGTVATGYLRNGYFEARELLAKHDENYMPKEVAESLKRTGYWRDAGEQ